MPRRVHRALVQHDGELDEEVRQVPRQGRDGTRARAVGEGVASLGGRVHEGRGGYGVPTVQVCRHRCRHDKLLSFNRLRVLSRRATGAESGGAGRSGECDKTAIRAEAGKACQLDPNRAGSGAGSRAGEPGRHFGVSSRFPSGPCAGDRGAARAHATLPCGSAPAYFPRSLPAPLPTPTRSMADTTLMDKLVSLCKRRGFVFQSSEIYGGLGSVWDYGPLGVELKKNVKDRWWQAMVHARDDTEGLDAAILMHPKVWEASGHIAGFTDPLIDCKQCKHRFRADDPRIKGTPGQPDAQCPVCGTRGSLTEPRMFNLMFKTFMGPVEESAAVIYLRPETAQGIYVNYLNVLQGSRQRVPFGIAQIGKAFRNEITPGNFIFRTREFEQMEMQFFVKPGTDAD